MHLHTNAKQVFRWTTKWGDTTMVTQKCREYSSLPQRSWIDSNRSFAEKNSHSEKTLLSQGAYTRNYHITFVAWWKIGFKSTHE